MDSLFWKYPVPYVGLAESVEVWDILVWETHLQHCKLRTPPVEQASLGLTGPKGLHERDEQKFAFFHADLISACRQRTSSWTSILRVGPYYIEAIINLCKNKSLHLGPQLEMLVPRCRHEIESAGLVPLPEAC